MAQAVEAKQKNPEEIEKHLKLLKRFVDVYCAKHHGENRGDTCEECSELVDYARKRLENCPYDPKPKCKDCPTHCYKPSMREKVKAVMRYSGMYFIKRGRVDWAIKYFL